MSKLTSNVTRVVTTKGNVKEFYRIYREKKKKGGAEFEYKGEFVDIILGEPPLIKKLSSAGVERDLLELKAILEDKDDFEAFHKTCDYLFHVPVLGKVTWPVVITGDKNKHVNTKWARLAKKYLKMKEDADKSSKQLFNALTGIENISLDFGGYFLKPLEHTLPEGYDIVETENVLYILTDSHPLLEDGLYLTKNCKELPVSLGNRENELIEIMNELPECEGRIIARINRPGEIQFAGCADDGFLQILDKGEFKKFVSKTKRQWRKKLADGRIKEKSMRVLENRLVSLKQATRMLNPSLNLMPSYGIFSFGNLVNVYEGISKETGDAPWYKKLLNRNVIVSMLGVTAAVVGGYYFLYLPEQRRREYEKTKKETFGQFESDKFLLNQLFGLSDFDDGRITHFEKQELLKLRDNLLNDYRLTFRVIVAGKYLADSAREFNDVVIGNSTLVNDVVDVILKHRLVNNGMDDPSGFASVPDLIKLIYYRWYPGYVDLENGTRISRRELSDIHVNASVALADYSRLVLPTLGASLISDERYASWAPYSQNASNDPRFSYLPFHSSHSLRIVDGIITGLPWDEKYVEVLYENRDKIKNWDEWYEWWSGQGKPYSSTIAKQWVKSIDFVPTKAAKDLDALKNGYLNATNSIFSYLPEERNFDVTQGDQFLVNRGIMVDKLPLEHRPFTIYTGDLHLYLEAHGIFDRDHPNSPSLPPGNLGAFRSYKEYEISIPEKALLYVTGVQYIWVSHGEEPAKVDSEYWGVIMIDDAMKDPRGNYTDPYSRSPRFYIVDGKLIGVGEPTPVPSCIYPFIDKQQTQDFYRELSIYSKNYILYHHLIDEGNLWLKVFDNTDEL